MQALINRAEARYNAAPGLHRVDTHALTVEHTAERPTSLTAHTENQSEGADRGFMLAFGCVCVGGIAVLVIGAQLVINALARGAA